MTFAVIPKTAGVCVLRDAADIALILCGHYLRMGLERLHIVDDGSTDGTFEKLEQLAHRSRGRVRVERHVLKEYRQPELISAAANTLIGEGFRLILPFDSDEFWALSPTDVATMVDQREPRIIGARWSNFVQRRNRRYPTPFGFLGVTYRADGRATPTGVEAFADAFVNHRETKIAIWSEHPVRFDRGQHMLVDGPQIRDPLERQIFHLPLRAQSEITKRALNYEARRRALREDDAVSWQSRFHEKATLDGLSASVWAANSADRAGRLDVYGRPEELVRDVRLRRLLLAAALHIALRYRMLPA